MSGTPQPPTEGEALRTVTTVRCCVKAAQDSLTVAYKALRRFEDKNDQVLFEDITFLPSVKVDAIRQELARLRDLATSLERQI